MGIARVMRIKPKGDCGFYDSLLAIEIGGIRFSREPQEYDWELDDGRITAIVLDGVRYLSEKDVQSDTGILKLYADKVCALASDAFRLARHLFDLAPCSILSAGDAARLGEVYKGLADLGIEVD